MQRFIFSKILVVLLLSAPTIAWSAFHEELLGPLIPNIPGVEVPGANVPLPPLIVPPLPPTTLSDLDPVCRLQMDTFVPRYNLNGTCGALGTNSAIPQGLYYADKRVDIETQCTWHDACYVARWYGGSYDKERCDAIFQDRMETECRRQVSRCDNVLNHCLGIVRGYASTVRNLGDTSWNSQGSDPRPADPSVFGASRSPSGQSIGSFATEQWVYVGKFHNGWLQRNFNTSTMVVPGQSLSASVNVNMRSDHIKFDRTTGNWTNAERIGLVRQGDTVVVESVTSIGSPPGVQHIWARIQMQ